MARLSSRTVPFCCSPHTINLFRGLSACTSKIMLLWMWRFFAVWYLHELWSTVPFVSLSLSRLLLSCNGSRIWLQFHMLQLSSQSFIDMLGGSFVSPCSYIRIELLPVGSSSIALHLPLHPFAFRHWQLPWYGYVVLRFTQLRASSSTRPYRTDWSMRVALK